MTRIEVLSSFKRVPGFRGGTVGQTAVTKMEKIRHEFGHYSSYTFCPICLLPFVLQRGRHHHIKGRRNIGSKNLDDGNNNIFFVWRFGCLEAEQKPVETSLSRNCQILPCTETRIACPPKQVHRSSMWHMKDNQWDYLFCKRFFLLI